ncbi:hypothetical protein MnTg02_01188 [bacterium MnTg02]|nr:hypothetical protein MnTg02_01188 [bacterium MnTg02]
MGRYANAATHHNSVHDGDIGLGVAGDQRIERIFPPPKALSKRRIFKPGIMKRTNVAARAKSPVSGAVNDDTLNGRIVTPPGQNIRYFLDHCCGEGV